MHSFPKKSISVALRVTLLKFSPFFLDMQPESGYQVIINEVGVFKKLRRTRVYEKEVLSTTYYRILQQ